MKEKAKKEIEIARAEKCKRKSVEKKLAMSFAAIENLSAKCGFRGENMASATNNIENENNASEESNERYDRVQSVVEGKLGAAKIALDFVRARAIVLDKIVNNKDCATQKE